MRFRILAEAESQFPWPRDDEAGDNVSDPNGCELMGPWRSLVGDGFSPRFVSLEALCNRRRSRRSWPYVLTVT